VGTENLAVTLGRAWGFAGHRLLIAGRDRSRTTAAVGQIGDAADAVNLTTLAAGSDAVEFASGYAVAWNDRRASRSQPVHSFTSVLVTSYDATGATTGVFGSSLPLTFRPPVT
jgi:hypothetical protein